MTTRLLEEGKLPNLESLNEQGSFFPLTSTLPPISPVAWPSFLTGVNPGKHSIFDFLTPDLKTYQPKLSSVEIRKGRARGIAGWFGGQSDDVRMLRKSQPFWSLLGNYGIFSSILRVPITFPPERLKGVLLSAMCVPDLRGTQGTFSHFTSEPESDASISAGGERLRFKMVEGRFESELLGPPDAKLASGEPLRLPFSIKILGSDTAQLKVSSSTIDLHRNRYTDWVTIRFPISWSTSVNGVCRFLWLPREDEPEHFELYVTPINIDPEHPAMPIGYPKVFPMYLAKKQGSYATLGLAEDTWGLSEQVLEDEHFLQQCTDIDREREAMFFDSLDKVTSGLSVCVFDSTDRMQHMFWRYLDPEHPARPDKIPPTFENAIEDLYTRMDGLVGRTIDKCHPDDLLIVLSDHGFNTFRRGVDLNRWLEEEGYLFVNEEKRSQEHLGGIDWTKTRAFSVGLTGIFINTQGRFSQGIVEPDQVDQLADEIISKLSLLVDPMTSQKAIKRIYPAARTYRGPYRTDAPDLIIGYASGYRISWDAAVGRTSKQIFHDNKKAWSGDHCVDPSVVPGVLFCNRKLQTQNPRLLDLAPTILSFFGVPTPDYMDGKAISLATPMPPTPVTKADPELQEVSV